MKKLLVVLNDLEGSGKSALARTLSHYLTENEIGHTLIISDERDVEAGLSGEYWDIEDEIEMSQLIRIIDRNEVVLVDVASGAARNWADFCESEELDAVLSEMDVEMTLIIPEHRAERCHEEIVDLAELFSDQADYVIAHLPIEPKGSVEEKWKGGYAAKAVNYLGALEISLPGLGSDLATALESSELTLGQAMGQMDALPRFLEVQVSEWREKAALACDRAADYLIPERVDGLVSSR
jgi:hypothetical protein